MRGTRRRGAGLNARGRDFRAAVLFLLVAFRGTGGSAIGSGDAFVDAGDNLADVDSVALLDEMLELAGDLGDDFARHLVGLDLKKGFARVDVGAVGFAPDAEKAGGDGLADGGNFDF